jgi:hypothetical protein
LKSVERVLNIKYGIFTTFVCRFAVFLNSDTLNNDINLVTFFEFDLTSGLKIRCKINRFHIVQMVSLFSFLTTLCNRCWHLQRLTKMKLQNRKIPTHRGIRYTGKMLQGLKERDHSEDMTIDGRLILQELLGRTNRLLPFIRHGPHRKRRVQQFFYCCVCIRYHGNVSTEPLPSNDRGGYTDTHTDRKVIS